MSGTRGHRLKRLSHRKQNCRQGKTSPIWTTHQISRNSTWRWPRNGSKSFPQPMLMQKRPWKRTSLKMNHYKTLNCLQRVGLGRSRSYKHTFWCNRLFKNWHAGSQIEKAVPLKTKRPARKNFTYSDTTPYQPGFLPEELSQKVFFSLSGHKKDPKKEQALPWWA